MSHSKERQDQTQQILVMGLAFGLYGISILIAERMPPLFLGPFELSMEYAFFLPLILCIFFHPFYAAAGAALAELVIGSMVFGQFEGFMMIGRFLALFAALWLGGMMVKNPRDKIQIAVAALAVVLLFQSANMVMSLLQLAAASKNLAAVPGLSQLLIIMEGFVFFKTVLVSGLLYTILPTILLVPYLSRNSGRSQLERNMEIKMLKPVR
ncbi:MAG TPA: hypothetical protein VK947_11070 [Planococcus sp. (in: firmicutes)]|nr:hypothetical protein [Planococcus sp. (in: firmicutes)]